MKLALVIALGVTAVAGCHSTDYTEIAGFDGKPTKVVDLSAEVKRRRKDFDNAEFGGVVSLLQLVANPERFHGKRIIVKGYALLEFESQGIFPSPDLAISTKNGVWLDYDFGSLPNDPSPSEFIPMLVEGVYDAKGGGHMGMWSGEICYIKRIERRDDKKRANQALLPTTTAVTPPAGQEPRRP